MLGPTADTTRVAAYIRWSTDEQGHGTTLAVQKERLGLFIRSRGWELSEELTFVDDGYSGATLERPGLTRLREAVREGRVGCVAVYRLDRLSRSLLDTVNLVRREWEGRAVLCSATENFDTHSPVGQMIFSMLASFAEFERSLIRDRTVSGKRKRAEQGRNAGQRYPLGYCRGAGGEWALDRREPETGGLLGPAALVRRIFDSFLGGMGTGMIARMLNAEGISTPQGKPWRFHYVSRILRNPIYAGRYRYGKGVSAVLVPGAVPPVLPAEQFDRVQRLLASHRGERSSPAAYPLTGIARCGRCQSPMAGSRGRRKRYYVCTGRTILHTCDCGYVDATLVEEALTAEARRHLAFQPDPRALAEWWEAAEDRQRTLVARLQSERTRLERQHRRLVGEFLAERLTARGFSQLTEQVQRELEEGETVLKEARQRLERLCAGPGDLQVVDPWSWLTGEELRQVLLDLTATLTLYRAPAGPGSRGRLLPVEVAWRPVIEAP